MASEIMYYEVTNSYGQFKKGLRFEVEHDSSRHIDASLKKALEKATGISYTQIPLNMLKCKKI